MMLCAGPVPGDALEPVPRLAYSRASSSIAPVPDALSFAPGSIPVSSRCAMSTIASGERPGAMATTFESCVLPIPGMSALKWSTLA